MTSEGKESEETRVRTSALTCLFCLKPKKEIRKDEKPNKDKDEYKDAEDFFWICDLCQKSEKERTEALEATLLKNGAKNIKDCTNDSVEGAILSEAKADDCHSCACQACAERRDLELEQEKELQSLQKCWVQLRHAVRCMYRDGLNKDICTGKGKQYDLEKLKGLIHQLCDRDPHQLYQRLESQGREYVMEMKVNLLQILISPEKVGLRSASPKPGDKGAGVSVTLEQTKCFLKSSLDNFSAFQETVRNMQPFMQELDRVHLEKFGITWKVINHHLFDSVVYQDALIQNSLPAMAEQLGVELIYPEEQEGKSKPPNDPNRVLPPAAMELAQSFRALDRLMRTSREIWEKANQRMEDFAKKQMRLYKATLKAKQRMLKEDLEFFKQQRRILEKYVAKSKAADGKDSEMKISNEEELAAFAETLRTLLAGGRPNRQHATSPTKCTRCQQRHCPCDECTISHVITCGLVSDDDQDLDLPLDSSILDELPDLQDMANFDESPYTTGDSSESDDDDAEFASDEDESPKHTDACGHIVCQKRTTIICSDGRKVTKTSSKYSTAVIPSTLYTLHGEHHHQHNGSSEQHFQHAYGDWEMPKEPTARIFSALDTCHLSDQNASRGGSSDRSSEQSAETNGNAKKSTESKPKMQSDSTKKDKDACYRQRTSSLPSAPTNMKNRKVKEAMTAKKFESLKLSMLKDSSALDISLDKLPPELIKIMKEETLAKALTVAAARRGLVKPPPNDSYYNWKDLEKLDWKDLNIDADALRKFYDQHNTEVKVVGEPKPPSKVKDGEKKEQTSVATQVELSTHLDDELEDSWSDDHSSSISQRDGKHCDCCYCEMFGHGGGDGRGPCGRTDYPQIRERLRLKLKKKGEEAHEAAVRLMESSERIEGHRGWASVDELLDYINGPKREGEVQEEIVAEQQSSSKAAKRQRQKQRKAEEKAKKGEKKRQKEANSAERNNNIKTENTNQVLRPKQEKSALKKAKNELSPSSPTKKAKKKSANWESANETNVEPDPVPKVFDEVFKPRPDLHNLDEADRDVEMFKQFVLESRPRENRPKVNLNLSSILKAPRNK